jgi:hypothetical protein
MSGAFTVTLRFSLIRPNPIVMLFYDFLSIELTRSFQYLSRMLHMDYLPLDRYHEVTYAILRSKWRHD